MPLSSSSATREIEVEEVVPPPPPTPEIPLWLLIVGGLAGVALLLGIGYAVGRR